MALFDATTVVLLVLLLAMPCVTADMLVVTLLAAVINSALVHAARTHAQHMS